MFFWSSVKEKVKSLQESNTGALQTKNGTLTLWTLATKVLAEWNKAEMVSTELVCHSLKQGSAKLAVEAPGQGTTNWSVLLSLWGNHPDLY